MKTNTLNRVLAVTCVALAAAAVTSAVAQTASPTLTPPAQRITDAAINADQQTFEALQARLKAINDGGRRVADYHLAKAQCWLDVSFHEYSRNDRGAFPQAALAKADLLARGMEHGQPPLDFDTPLVADAVRLRPDLWARTEALKTHRGFKCAQQKIACAEVELVHAGHEHHQLEWRHAKPYVQIAEDLIAEAHNLAQRCEPPPPPPPVEVAAVVPPPVAAPAPVPATPKAAPLPVPVPVQVALAVTVLFAFDRYLAADIRPESQVAMQALVARVRSENLAVRRLHLVGHADRLNGTGQAGYNQRLSERRAATVRAELARLGLPVADVTSAAVGSAQPALDCPAQAPAARLAVPASGTPALQACLLPNRRVEVQIAAEQAGR